VAVEARLLVLRFEEGVLASIESNADEKTGVIPQRRRWWEVLPDST